MSELNHVLLFVFNNIHRVEIQKYYKHMYSQTIKKKKDSAAVFLRNQFSSWCCELVLNQLGTG